MPHSLLTLSSSILGYYWAESSVEKKLPQNAIQGGTDMDGSKIYIGLSKFQGDELPAKVIPEKKAAYVSHGGKEHSVKEYKVSSCAITTGKYKLIFNIDRFFANIPLYG